jgi:3-oxoisoapionate decarboxylase
LGRSVHFYNTIFQRLQLGLSTYSFPWAIGVQGSMPRWPMQATDLLQYAKQKGIGCIQFGDNLPLHQLSESEQKDLKELACALRVNIEVGTRRLTKEQILLYLPIAQLFRSAFIRVVIDDSDYHPGEAAVIKEIESLLPQLQQHNVILAIENHDRFPAKSLERIIRNTDEKLVGICLDTANSLGAGEGVGEVLQTLAPYTVNLHIKDIVIKRLPHKMGFTVEGCAAGKGMLDIPAIVGELKRYDRCRTATLEVWSQPEGTVDESIAKEKRWVEESIYYLKPLLS